MITARASSSRSIDKMQMKDDVPLFNKSHVAGEAVVSCLNNSAPICNLILIVSLQYNARIYLTRNPRLPVKSMSLMT